MVWKSHGFKTTTNFHYTVPAVCVVPFRYFTGTASSFDVVREKNMFSSSTEPYFNHTVITARRLVHVE